MQKTHEKMRKHVPYCRGIRQQRYHDANQQQFFKYEVGHMVTYTRCCQATGIHHKQLLSSSCILHALHTLPISTGQARKPTKPLLVYKNGLVNQNKTAHATTHAPIDCGARFGLHVYYTCLWRCNHPGCCLSFFITLSTRACCKQVDLVEN